MSEFNANAALLELYKYAVTYNEEVWYSCYSVRLSEGVF